jgi:hypothetical protein
MPSALSRLQLPAISLETAPWKTTALRSGRVAVPYVLPLAVVALAIVALLWHGPVAQLPHYHDFADRRSWLGIANAADVLSNLGFAWVGLQGLWCVHRWWHAPALRPGRGGWLVFFFALLLTSAGSAWYHLAPDNARLVWDRLPIALACAGLLAACWRETIGAGRWLTPALAACALASVAWWRYTDLQGTGDLRPYLLLQFLPLVLVPLLQWQHDAPMVERLAIGGAMGLYVLAKAFELSDHATLQALGLVSGHTVKHLLATLAAALICWSLDWRLQQLQ